MGTPVSLTFSSEAGYIQMAFKSSQTSDMSSFLVRMVGFLWDVPLAFAPTPTKAPEAGMVAEAETVEPALSSSLVSVSVKGRGGESLGQHQ